MQPNKSGKIEVVQKSYWNSIPTIFKTDLLNKCGKPRSGSVLQYVFDHLIVYLSWVFLKIGFHDAYLKNFIL